jgi:phosphohistidine phosphatase SixA
MRHGKSSWTSGASTDHARPLNDRGRRDAPRVADKLVELGWQPQLILSSDAQRTRETVELMRPAWPSEVPVEFLRALYLAGYDALANLCSIVDDDVVTLLTLGHNPGCEGIVEALTGEPVLMKTATAALLTGEGANWSAALGNRRQWKTVEVIYPREL